MKKIVLFILLMLPVVVLASDVERRSVEAFWNVWYYKETKEVEIIGIRSDVYWFEEDLRKESVRKYWKDQGTLIIPATVKVGNDECKVVGICDEAFFRNSIYDTKLGGVVIGENVRVIGKSAFQNQYLRNIEIQGNSLEEVKSRAFFGCLRIEKLELPSSIKRIGAYAFCGGFDTPDYGVKDIYCYAADPPKCGSSAFYVYKNFDGKRCCYAPKESIDKYKEVLHNYFFYFIPLPETAGIDDKKMSVSESDNHRIICQGNTIIISGTTIGDPVSIYNLEGQRLYSSVCDKGTTTISIPFSYRNLVIIKVGKKIIKCNLK